MQAISLSRLLLVAALASACASWHRGLPERASPEAGRRIQVELSKYEKSLKLSISPEHNQIAPRQRLLVMFTLRNDGPEGLKPCLAERGALHFWGLDKSYVTAAEISMVDHAFCKTSLPVASGESVSWSREIIVPSIPSSTAKLIASIYLIYPNDCDRYGCDGIYLSADVSSITVTNDTSALSFSNMQAEYGSLAEVHPVAVVQSGDPIYLMSMFPRYAAFLQRWDEETQRWENGQRPITCATIKDARVPISVRHGARVPLATYWEWTVERRDEEVFKVGAYESRPIAGKYRLIVNYAREPWAFGKSPSIMLSVFSPTFRIRDNVPAQRP